MITTKVSRKSLALLEAKRKSADFFYMVNHKGLTMWAFLIFFAYHYIAGR